MEHGMSGNNKHDNIRLVREALGSYDHQRRLDLEDVQYFNNNFGEDSDEDEDETSDHNEESTGSSAAVLKQLTNAQPQWDL